VRRRCWGGVRDWLLGLGSDGWEGVGYNEILNRNMSFKTVVSGFCAGFVCNEQFSVRLGYVFRSATFG
jgi:hypothetical protein